MDEVQASHYVTCTKEKEIHHQLTGSMASRVQQDVAKVTYNILKHCARNPFAQDMALINIASNMTMSCTAERETSAEETDISGRDRKGDQAFKSYVADRLVNTTAKMSMRDLMKKLPKAFANWENKTFCTMNKKVIKLREDRQLLARFLVIQRSQRELLQKLNY